jgi:hypothetical protein
LPRGRLDHGAPGPHVRLEHRGHGVNKTLTFLPVHLHQQGTIGDDALEQRRGTAKLVNEVGAG